MQCFAERMATFRRSPQASEERLSLTVTLPNEQRIEILKAVVRWLSGQEFAVENLAPKQHTHARLCRLPETNSILTCARIDTGMYDPSCLKNKENQHERI